MGCRYRNKILSSQRRLKEIEELLENYTPGEEVVYQSDWSELNDESPSFIKNKPTNVSSFSNDSHYVTENDLKLAGIDPNGHEYVDLGLSVKWAKYNLGSNSETGYGLYYQWGDTLGYESNEIGASPLKEFTYDTYKYSNNGGSTSADMTKYNSSDLKEILDSSDDAARVSWGGSWRMPTVDEFTELLNATSTISQEVITIDNKYVVKFTLIADPTKYIIFPFGGFGNNSSINGTNMGGLYWASSLNRHLGWEKSHFFLYYDHGSTDITPRSRGFNIRPVLATELIGIKSKVLQLESTLSGISNKNASQGGNDSSLVTTGDKYIWNNKANIWSGTQAEYDLIQTKDPNTIYIIIPPVP